MKVSVRSRFWVAVCFSALMAVLSASRPGSAAEWIKVGEGKLRGISGIALLSRQAERTDFLVVHDNKDAGEPRLGVLIASPARVEYRVLAWPGDGNPPVDLEAISSVPGEPGNFLAVTSRGQVFRLAVSGTEVTILGDFLLPDLPPQANIEGFSVQKLGFRLVAAWGHRGSGLSCGRLFWGWLDLPNKSITDVSTADIAVPFPSPSDPNTRHITDLKLDSNGVLWASATNDPGDSGPFISAVYTLGALSAPEARTIRFEPNPDLTRLWVFPKKVEGLELVPGPSGAIAFGSDDEDDGGWIFFTFP
jgi:hypothetical protein